MANKKSESVMRAQRRKKELVVQRMGGKCQICGYDRCINALEFHHIDPKTKTADPSYLVMRSTWDKAQVELAKCIMICANCHREIHYKHLDVNFQSIQKTWFDVTCQTCQTHFTTQEETQFYCSNSCRGIDTRKVSRPSKEELCKLIESTSWVQLGKMFGVSDNAVRKWARTYQLI